MPEPPPPPEYVSWNIFTWMVGGIGAILVGVIAWEVNTLLPRTEFEIWRASQETQISEIKDELQEMNDLIREDIKEVRELGRIQQQKLLVVVSETIRHELRTQKE